MSPGAKNRNSSAVAAEHYPPPHTPFHAMLSFTKTSRKLAIFFVMKPWLLLYAPDLNSKSNLTIKIIFLKTIFPSSRMPPSLTVLCRLSLPVTSDWDAVYGAHSFYGHYFSFSSHPSSHNSKPSSLFHDSVYQMAFAHFRMVPETEHKTLHIVDKHFTSQPTSRIRPRSEM